MSAKHEVLRSRVREEAWETRAQVQIFDSGKEPEVKFSWHTIRVTIPGEKYTYIFVEIEPHGLVGGIEDHSLWFGRRYENMSFPERKEIWDWLVEWELVALRKVGYDDSEYFATKKLDSEFGLD